jgi:multisubunit Na+/H+ antiporter MnhG subunit
MVPGRKWMLTYVSSNLVLYGVSFVVHSSLGMVRIVIVF